jgi:hypothetical protein
MQRKYFKNAVYSIIASMEEVATLKKGDRVDRPYRSALVVKTVGTDGAYTRQAITDTTEYLTVSTKKEVTFNIEDYDEIQSNYATRNLYADDAGMALKLYIDGDVLGEYDIANSSVDDGDLGGTDGNGFTLTISNILSVFGKARKKLDRLNIPENDRWAIISPEFADVLYQFLAGKESALGDSTGINGHIGKYGGFQLYKSNALGWSARLVMSTIATDTDTVTINGVVFTADADGAAVGAGHFSIQASATLCCGQLADAINNSGAYAASVGTVDTYIEVTAANRILLEGITAVFTAGNTYLTLKGEGVGYVAVSETLTPAADVWTTALQIQHNLFGQGKPVDLVIQKYPTVSVFHRDGYFSWDIANYILMGLKTFAEGAKQMVDVQCLSGAF